MTTLTTMPMLIMVMPMIMGILLLTVVVGYFLYSRIPKVTASLKVTATRKSR